MVITKKATEKEETKKQIGLLLERLDIKYVNISNYILAFIHRSIVNERPDFTPTHNERLEFLWDAVLELVITNNLYADFKDKQEWELTDMRSSLVRWRNLATIAKELKLSKYLFLWKWEELSWWRDNDYILANTLEAFLWALYLDLWFDAASDFIWKHIYSTLDDIMKNNFIKDYKTIIQELVQARFDITPVYKVLSESWPDHDKNFIIWIYMGEECIGKWNWTSKKKAQESAAENAFNNINNKK